jgi:uncharacterized membrane protein
VKRDERGAILVLAAGGIVLAMIASALAVDLGFIARDARTNQKIADMAALDAARALPGNPTQTADDSVKRNDPARMLGNDFVVECRTAAINVFSDTLCASGESTAVKVSVHSIHKNVFPFVSQSKVVTRAAIGQIQRQAGFSLGSSLARVEAGAQSPIFNRVFERFLGLQPGSLTVLDAVSYKGLADAYVTLGRLQAELGFATVDELLSADLTVKRLLEATSVVMNNEGVAGSAYIDTIVATIGPASVANTSEFKLGDMITVASGAEGAAASTGINVLQLLTGSAELANHDTFVTADQFIDVPDSLGNVSVLNVGNVGTGMSLKVIEPPQIYIGQQGGTVHTAQVEIKFSPTIDVGITLPGPVGSLLRAVGTLTVVTGGADATGTLTTVRCTAPQGIDVTVDTAAMTTQVSTTTPVSLRTALNVVAGSVNVSGAATGLPNSQLVPFAYPTEFSPDADSKQTNTASLNTNVTSTSSGNVAIGIPPLINVNLAAGVVSGAVLTSVKPLLDKIAERLKTPEFAALGISLGIADVAALRDAFAPTGCGQPGLID